MSAHKWWRVAEIKARAVDEFKGIAILQFIDANGNNLATNPAKGFASHYYGMPSNENAPANAFDGNPDTWTDVKFNNKSQDWKIGYEFDEPVEIAAIGIKGRNDLPAGFGREWQTAVVEVSDDGATWLPYAKIAPNIEAEDSSLHIVLITTASSISINILGASRCLNVYTVDESGSISGVVQEKGLPIRAEVALHDRLTRKTVAITWSDSEGNYSFSGLDKNREYYAEALHPTRKFNLVGQDGLRSGMTT